MLPPAQMLAKKNRFFTGAIIFFTLAIFAVGCAPPGTRALLKGKKFLDRGDYADAVAELKAATTILATNAQAWNYLGVAEQHAGQSDDAMLAYQRALSLDRDLVEAHYNLGCLWLDRNKPDDAKSEFTAYTLRRANTPEGWLKLGLAQLRLRDIPAAEKSFSTARYLSPNNAEALNGLGLARIERGRLQDAAKFFEAAVRNHPDYAPAILNLATVAHEYLHDDRLALENYRAWLALTPHPANWNEVNAIAAELEKSTQPAVVPPPHGETQPVQSAPKKQTRPTELVQPVRAAPQHEVVRRSPPPREPQPQPRQQVVRANPAPPREQTETVRVQPEPVVAAAPAQSNPETNPFASVATSLEQESSASHNFNPFHRHHPSPAQEIKVTPLPPEHSSATENAARRPIHIVQAAPPVFPRYLYLSPRKPEPGDRPAATTAFEQARKYEAANKFPDALNSYRQAAHLDPSWFEAQYNCGVMAYRLRDFDMALVADEMALAIQSDSADARYNFAITLKSAGYVTDAVNELKKILVANPNDVRAHLALGNIYAQELHDVSRARIHYLKVLELDPRNPRTSDIQFWLSANPP